MSQNPQDGEWWRIMFILSAGDNFVKLWLLSLPSLSRLFVVIYQWSQCWGRDHKAGQKNKLSNADSIFKYRSLVGNCDFFIHLSLKLVHKGLIDAGSRMVQVKSWRQPGGKPSLEQIIMQITDAYLSKRQCVKPLQLIRWMVQSCIPYLYMIFVTAIWRAWLLKYFYEMKWILPVRKSCERQWHKPFLYLLEYARSISDDTKMLRRSWSKYLMKPGSDVIRPG